MIYMLRKVADGRYETCGCRRVEVEDTGLPRHVACRCQVKSALSGTYVSPTHSRSDLPCTSTFIRGCKSYHADIHVKPHFITSRSKPIDIE